MVLLFFLYNDDSPKCNVPDDNVFMISKGPWNGYDNCLDDYVYNIDNDENILKDL